MRLNWQNPCLLLLLAAILCACTNDTLFSRFQHIDSDGWKREKSVSFSTDTIQAGTVVAAELAVRVRSGYEYKNLSVIVDVYQAEVLLYSDTVNCNLTNGEGRLGGNGLMHREFVFPLQEIIMYKPAPLSFQIRHNMKNGVIADVEDVGIVLQRQGGN